jgi:tRNA pseudouridine38-40 synthase
LPNIKLIIEYEGTAYGGWQSQTNASTVQDVLLDAIRRVTGGDAKLYGSGRTDSGVHALGQVANFMTEAEIPAERYASALNTLLPDDIRVKNSCLVPDSFHAQFSATGKRYRYTIYNNRQGTALHRRTCWHVGQRLGREDMAEAARHFIGMHDFTAFQSAGGVIRETVKTVTLSEITSDGPFIHFDVAADGFLYNMVRIMAGTLVKVGRGRLKPDDIPLIIESRDRERAGYTAPAHGLCLMEVYYSNMESGVG